MTKFRASEMIYFMFLTVYLQFLCSFVATHTFLTLGPFFETYARVAEFFPFLWIVAALFFALTLCIKPRQSAKSFIRHRILTAFLVFVLEILFWVNAFTIGVCSIWISLAIIILMHMILLYFPIPLIHAFPLMFTGMKISYLKTAKINFSGKLIMLFFYLPILIFIFYTCQIDLDTWDEKRRPENFNYVCGFFIVSMPLSIPVLYQAILAWNTKKLMFIGLHPTTGREWEGIMKKNKDGEWEVDLEPEDHELVEVRVL